MSFHNVFWAFACLGRSLDQTLTRQFTLTTDSFSTLPQPHPLLNQQLACICNRLLVLVVQMHTFVVGGTSANFHNYRLGVISFSV